MRCCACCGPEACSSWCDAHAGFGYATAVPDCVLALQITYGDPGSRLFVLEPLQWDIKVHLAGAYRSCSVPSLPGLMQGRFCACSQTAVRPQARQPAYFHRPAACERRRGLGVGTERPDHGRLPLHLRVPQALAAHGGAQIYCSVGRPHESVASEFGQPRNGGSSRRRCLVIGCGESQPAGLGKAKPRPVSALFTHAVQGAGRGESSRAPCAAAGRCACAPLCAAR